MIRSRTTTGPLQRRDRQSITRRDGNCAPSRNFRPSPASTGREERINTKRAHLIRLGQSAELGIGESHELLEAVDYDLHIRQLRQGRGLRALRSQLINIKVFARGRQLDLPPLVVRAP